MAAVAQQHTAAAADAEEAPWCRWDAAAAGPDTLSRCGHTFTRPAAPGRSHGVRGAGPLPPDAAWIVTFDHVGSHGSVGVATGDCKLQQDGYGFLFGQTPGTPDSWALCFGNDSKGSFQAASGGASQLAWTRAAEEQLPQPLRVSLRLEAGTKLYAAVRGSGEKLLFPDLPQGAPLFAVAATVWGGGNVTIKERRDEEQKEFEEVVVATAAVPRAPQRWAYHMHRQDGCRICVECRGCTGSGGSCVKVHGRDRGADAGGPCGCGRGETGCLQCGRCRACCAAVDRAAADEHAAADDAAAAAAADDPFRPLTTTAFVREQCDGGAPAVDLPAPAASSSSSPAPLPLFPSVFEGDAMHPRCLLELQLMKLVGAIRDKPQWKVKLQDQQVVGRWRTEAAAQGASKEVLDLAFQQLEHEATLPGPGTEGAVPGVYSSDDLVPEDLRQALLEEVARLEALPPDWHPGSEQQVLDLVHPSLYCLVFNVSKQLPEGQVNLSNCLQLMSTGVPVAPPAAALAPGRSQRSAATQWLPTNVDVVVDGGGAGGGAVRCAWRSYINNLHPERHAALYGVLGRVLAAALPLLERVLERMASPVPALIDPYAAPWFEEFKGDYDDDSYEEWWENREFIPPVLPTQFQPPAPAAAVSLRGRRLQVIVKLANIHLTPEKPKYNGGAWHVEGMLNERIVASCIYYYDQDNVTDSRLAFRAAIEEPNYEQNDNKGVEAMFGMEGGEALNQELGAVTTLPGRCLCFPNTHQHQVQPFQLLDPQRPGHRKILVFFLLDPAQAVLSTSEVPPQQMEWWQQEILKDPHTSLARMPREVMDAINDALVDDTLREPGSCPFSMEQARLYREQLMEERKYYIDTQNDDLFEREFSLCEH